MKFIVSVFLLVLCMETTAQNMVPNHSFEQYIACPDNEDQMWRCTDWNKYTTLGTSDFYHACGTNGFNVPALKMGAFQSAASGHAFAGVHTYNPFQVVKEYIKRPINALQPGCTYEVSLSVSLEDHSGYGSDDLGVFFYQWWLPSETGDFMAEGILGQYVYVNPAENVVIVRMGKNGGKLNWSDFFSSLAKYTNK